VENIVVYKSTIGKKDIHRLNKKCTQKVLHLCKNRGIM
jgi:hypothetical protein